MAKEKSGYTGKVTNAGAQKIDAPVAAQGKKGKTTVVTGRDLRTGK